MQLIGSDNFSIVIGLGKTGLSCARYLAAKGTPFAIADTRELPPNLDAFKQAFPQVEVRCGELDSDWLSRAGRLIVSPGVSRNEPAILAAEQAGVDVLGDIDLFCQQVQHDDTPIVAITGSNAKSSVTTLVGLMAERAGIKAGVGGNLGVPVLDLLEDQGAQLYVLELSSFQLETTEHLRAAAATVLNVSPDHMDRYADLASYHAAKQRIYLGCQHGIYNFDDHLTLPLLPDGVPQTAFRLGAPDLKQFGLVKHEGRTWLAKGPTLLLACDQMKLRGAHNQANALAALALGEAIGLPMEPMLEAVKEFEGLPHRCQWVRELDRVSYYNDSKGTNVGATLAAIEGLGPELEPGAKIVLIAGGDGKGAEFDGLAGPMTRFGRAAVLIGRDGPRIESDLGSELNRVRAASLEEAVGLAQGLAKPGDLVLLSPACASFDMFKGFEHRGDCFVEAVRALNSVAGGGA
ncbi:UDP-N-acetylmuramoyl-L-alanine--D-glutamate ligase [Motiliproteus coralliicola]|uniref:UDP-N-acetylmuramoylalanine--D-glutamate ligase n=1 Tax=Motiliproteus coralliicola TaxID=2283196 RepID=A0A369WL39_9GAMM|nr:UDP-N-acetylmuramoyl-L-alanine--D-glutamate ligase [Motiliproteus coralliicola]RDE22790.1 UDP-N-acetylmuramoyl-L-alanine--D-glutamate ligase [Motiliproteus coralliicola]